MGKGKKAQPSKLPAKLRAVRNFFNFSQEDMIKSIVPGVEDAASARAAISDYESGRRTPSLLEVHNYAKAIRRLTPYRQLNVEDLIDDERELPFSLEAASTANEDEKNAPFQLASVEQNGFLANQEIKPRNRREVAEAIGTENQIESFAQSKIINELEGEENKSEMACDELSGRFVGNSNIDNNAVIKLVTEEEEDEKVEEIARFFIKCVSKRTESLNIELNGKTLDRLENAQLELMRSLPRAERRSLNVSCIVDFCVSAVLRNFD